MSVIYGVEFVDWSTFKKLWKQHGEPSFFQQAEEFGADWIVKIGPQPRWNSSWYATIDFSDTFKQLREFLGEPGRKKFETSLGGLLVADDKNQFHPPNDLGEEIDETIFFSMIAPETAQRLLKSWEKLDMEELRLAFEQIKSDPRGHMRTFEHFKRYLEMWADLLRDAVGKKAGIVITLG